MHHAFGDYRLKMAEENERAGKAGELSGPVFCVSHSRMLLLPILPSWWICLLVLACSSHHLNVFVLPSACQWSFPLKSFVFFCFPFFFLSGSLWEQRKFALAWGQIPRTGSLQVEGEVVWKLLTFVLDPSNVVPKQRHQVIEWSIHIPRRCLSRLSWYLKVTSSCCRVSRNSLL